MIESGLYEKYPGDIGKINYMAVIADGEDSARLGQRFEPCGDGCFVFYFLFVVRHVEHAAGKTCGRSHGAV